ncbi:TfoX/Sxy family protein [Propionibacteriaceae bacterium Y1685]|uniref:TfoX/Sxy family protein n=1 Tax=Microlunatus sp. Y1700 TaxID=3418487 RepID=UPI003B7B3E59
MAHDSDLADRIREHLAHRSDVRERSMFGGLAFLVNGNMAVAANRKGELLVRVDPADAEALLADTTAEQSVMGSRTMRGWLDVETADLSDGEVAAWLDRGVARAESLPAK